MKNRNDVELQANLTATIVAALLQGNKTFAQPLDEISDDAVEDLVAKADYISRSIIETVSAPVAEETEETPAED